MLLSTIARLGLAAAVVLAPTTTGPATPHLGEHAPVRHEATTGPDPTMSKTAMAICPSPLSVFAAGARVVGGQGQVVLTAAVPDPTLSTVTAAATARGGFTGAWALVAYAICDRSVVLPVRTAEPADGQTSATATCPGAGRLTGTGFRFEGSVESLGLTEVAIGPGLRTVRVGVGGAGPPERVTAYGICRPPTPDEAPPRTLVTHVEEVGQWPAAATVTESISDMTVWGVGASVTGPGDPFLTALVPNPTAGMAVAEAAGGVSGFARMAADGDDDDGEVGVTGLVVGVFH